MKLTDFIKWNSSFSWAARVIRSPIPRVLSTLSANGVRALLMGGQACVLYGAAELIFSLGANGLVVEIAEDAQANRVLPQVKEKKLTPELIEETRGFIRQSVAGMKHLLLDAAKNTPKPREAFAFTENTRLCGSCVFYKICEKYQL